MKTPEEIAAVIRSEWKPQAHGPYDYDWLQTLIADAIRAERLRAERLASALREIRIHYNHPMHDHNWAHWVYERTSNSLREYDGGEG